MVNFTASNGGTPTQNSQNKKREIEREKSSVSTDSSMSSSGAGQIGGNSVTNANNSGASSKLSKIGRRLRDSCRNLRSKGGSGGSGGAKCNPTEDFDKVKSDKESNRSKHYVAMDFSGKVGKICAEKDIKAYTSRDGYAYFRRKVLPKEVINLLTESQSQIHLTQPWFHRGLGRDVAQRVLAAHNVDG